MTCKCGRQTNDPSGVCAICNLKANDPDTIKSDVRPQTSDHRLQKKSKSFRGQSYGSEPTAHRGSGSRQKHKDSTKTAQRHEGQPKARVEKKNNVPRRDLICIQCLKPYKPTSSAQKRCPTCKKIHIARKKTLQSSNNCSVEGCKNPIKSRGMCNKHYLQKLKDEGRIGIRKTPRNSQASSGRHSREGGNPVHRTLRGKKELDTRLKTSGMTKNQKFEDFFDYLQDERKQTPDVSPQLKAVIPAKAGIQSLPSCRICGCTDADSSGCIERTGQPCYWIEDDLCSACQNVIPAKAGIQSGSNGFLAQMLYASDLLDKQINSVLENGSIDTKIILDIRFRLGEVVRGSIKT